MNQQYYTGVGSRSTPDDMLKLMKSIAIKMAHQGVILRSGGALGADLAFEYGCNSVAINLKAIFRPYQCTPEALEIASMFHPVWNRLGQYVRTLHGRNAFQVLGLDLKTPSKALICWTPDGCTTHASRSVKTGGTGTAISIADHYRVPVFNLSLPAHEKSWVDWLNK